MTLPNNQLKSEHLGELECWEEEESDVESKEISGRPGPGGGPEQPESITPADLLEA